MTSPQTFYEFQLSNLPDNARILVIGQSGSGKSELIRAIMHSKRKNLDHGIVISGTEKTDPFFQHFIPSSYIYDKFDPSIIKKFVEYQSQATACHGPLKHEIKMLKSRLTRLKKTGNDNEIERLANEARKKTAILNTKRKRTSGFIIIDDCSWKKNITKTDEMREMYMTGSHCDIFNILAVQYCMDFDSSVRDQVTHIFIFYTNQLTALEKFWKHYIGIFPNLNQFKKVFFKLTEEQYHCIVIDKTKNSRELNESIFWYKANLHGDFRVGSDEYWKKHKIHLREKAKKKAKHTKTKTVS